MKHYIQTFDEVKERVEKAPEQWLWGAVVKDLAPVPLADRLIYSPPGVPQFNKLFDTNGCASRDKLNVFKAKLTYFYHNGMHDAIKKWLKDNGYVVFEEGMERIKLADAFIEILSGTDPHTGNSMYAPIKAIYDYGVIPASLLPFHDDMTVTEYYDKKRLTDEMYALGKEFKRRISFNFEQVPSSSMQEAREEDYLCNAGYAWPTPVNGVYPRTDARMNHAFATADPEIHALDNYQPFTKLLAKDYLFFDWGYSLSITAQNPYPEEVLTLFEVLKKHGLLAFFAEAVQRLLKQQSSVEEGEGAEEAPEASKPPEQPKIPDTLLDVAKKSIGKEVSPRDLVSDEFGCAESLSMIIRMILPAFPVITGTWTLLDTLKRHKSFEKVLEPKAGDIILCATGTGRGSIPNGHTGIISNSGFIMSNDSKTGLWNENFTISTWRDRYEILGKYPVHYFRLKVVH